MGTRRSGGARSSLIPEQVLGAASAPTLELVKPGRPRLADGGCAARALAHPNAAAARVSTEQLATCPLDGGPGANISFELPQDQGLGVNAWIDPETGGLVDVETLTFTGDIEIRIDSETLTCTDDTSHPVRVGEGARR